MFPDEKRLKASPAATVDCDFVDFLGGEVWGGQRKTRNVDFSVRKMAQSVPGCTGWTRVRRFCRGNISNCSF